LTVVSARRTRALSTGSASLKRYKSQLKRAVSDAVNRRSITDIDAVKRSVFQIQGYLRADVSIMAGLVSKDMIHPGNKEFEAGDRVQRPEEGSGGGSGQGQGRERWQG
jgi:uncharacterized sporulation protein YeaH/YhbH (DUF444 family)